MVIIEQIIVAIMVQLKPLYSIYVLHVYGSLNHLSRTYIDTGYANSLYSPVIELLLQGRLYDNPSSLKNSKC